MNIVYIHRGGENMASYRYRTQIPAKELEDDYAVSINSGEADIVIFSKPVKEDIEIARTCRNDGTKVIVDYCDNHFNHSTQGQIYREMANISDMVVCNSKEMRNIIYTETGKEAYQIDDPYEQERMPPHAEGENYLWFGHQLNIPEIIPWIGKVPNLAVCTGQNNQLVNYIPWSQENLKHALENSNIVFLPQKAQYKSPNRLINSIMAGCFVISHDKEFREFTWTGNPYTGFQWVRAFKNDLNTLVSNGQDYIEKFYSPKVIGQQWKTMLKAI